MFIHLYSTSLNVIFKSSSVSTSSKASALRNNSIDKSKTPSLMNFFKPKYSFFTCFNMFISNLFDNWIGIHHRLVPLFEAKSSSGTETRSLLGHQNITFVPCPSYKLGTRIFKKCFCWFLRQLSRLSFIEGIPIWSFLS